MAEASNLSREFARIEERLRAVEIQLGRLSAQLAGEREHIARHLAELQRAHEGHGRILKGDNGSSLLTRVALLEEMRNARQWSSRAAWLAVTALLVKIVYDIFTPVL